MHVDRALRALLLRGLSVALPRARGRGPGSARRVLLLRHDRIGDMLMSTGLLRLLHEARPALEIDVLASAANAPVLAGHPAVRSVHVLEPGGRGLRRIRPVLREARYDAVLDGLVLKPSVNSRTALLLHASGAPLRVGVGGRGNDFLYTHRVRPPREDSHHVDYLAALATPFGVDPSRVDISPDLPLSADERARADVRWREVPGQGLRLFVNVSAGEWWRRWPDARFGDVLRWVRGRGPARIAVTGAPEDAASYRALAGGVGGSALALPLRDALAMVATADVVLTPDTSIAHAAAAARRPSVVMLPLVTSRRFVPYHLVGRAVYAEDDTLDSLDVAPVLDALAEVIADAEGGR